MIRPSNWPETRPWLLPFVNHGIILFDHLDEEPCDPFKTKNNWRNLSNILYAKAHDKNKKVLSNTYLETDLHLGWGPLCTSYFCQEVHCCSANWRTVSLSELSVLIYFRFLDHLLTHWASPCHCILQMFVLIFFFKMWR